MPAPTIDAVATLDTNALGGVLGGGADLDGKKRECDSRMQFIAQDAVKASVDTANMPQEQRSKIFRSFHDPLVAACDAVQQ